MKYLASSSLVISIIQIVSLLITILGFFYFTFDATAILTIIGGYFLLSGIGVGITMHRFYSHRSFEFKWKIVKWIFTWIAIISGRGSIIGWVYVHREHHKNSDTVKDPHLQFKKKWHLFFPHLLKYGNSINKFLVKDMLTKEHIHFNKFYVLYILSWALVLFFISPWLMYFGWIIPLALTQLTINSFLYTSHSIGYENHNTINKSKNFWFYGLIFWGEGWHNNHHHNPGNYTTKEKWWEIDILGSIIRLVKRDEY